MSVLNLEVFKQLFSIKATKKAEIFSWRKNCLFQSNVGHELGGKIVLTEANISHVG